MTARDVEASVCWAVIDRPYSGNRRDFLLINLHGLPHRTVTRGIPRRDSDPLLARWIERNVEAPSRHWRQLRCRNDLSAGGHAVAPNDLDEVQWKRPFNFRSKNLVTTGTCDGKGRNQDLAR